MINMEHIGTSEVKLIGPPVSPDKVKISTDSFENNCCQRRNLVNNPGGGVGGKIDHGY